MLKNYFKIAWPSIYKNKATAFIIIAASVGMIANLAVGGDGTL